MPASVTPNYLTIYRLSDAPVPAFILTRCGGYRRVGVRAEDKTLPNDHYCGGYAGGGNTPRKIQGNQFIPYSSSSLAS